MILYCEFSSYFVNCYMYTTIDIFAVNTVIMILVCVLLISDRSLLFGLNM